MDRVGCMPGVDADKDIEVSEAARKYTYEDYMNSDDDIRFELIDGVMYMMATPSWIHQSIIGELYVQLYSFLKDKPCKVFFAPLSVCLSIGEGADTVLEPDLFVLCDKSQLFSNGCNGAPDMVVEILSPSSIRHDRVRKLRVYQNAGVREYWIVDPDSNSVSVHVMENGRLITSIYSGDDIVPVHVLEGCEIHLSDVFTE